MYYLIRSNRIYGYPMTEPRPPKLLDQVRDVLRLKHYAFSTEKTYLQWIYRYIVFHNKRHPQDMGKVEIEAFLTHLAVQEQVTASTQNQAFSAILFLYRHVLHQELDTIDALRARSSRYLPTVLTPPEVQTIFRQLCDLPGLVVPLLYGSGLRLSEGLNLRVKDLDFAQRQLIVRDAKGNESRVTMLPARLIEPLQTHLNRVRRTHQHDLDQGYGTVYLP
jgi:integrase